MQTHFREICGDNIDCLVGVWISEQSLCTLIDLEETCGIQAAKFYAGIRKEVFNSFYPVLCFSQHGFGMEDQGESLHSIVGSKTRIAVEAASDIMIKRRQERSYDILGAARFALPDISGLTGREITSEMLLAPEKREAGAGSRLDTDMKQLSGLLGSLGGMPWYLANSLPRPPSRGMSETDLYGAKVDRNFPLLIYTTLKDLMERFVHIYFNQEYARA